jgi:PPOX class probable F420-dependent enzyme
MEAGEARARFAAKRVARLATADFSGQPHLVAICFALAGDVAYTAIDHKPKATMNLRRLRNIMMNSRVSLLADHYEDDDWARLWWVRADGSARQLDAGEPEHERAVELLVERYRQYREQPPAGPVIAVDVERWVGWAAAP